MESTQPVFTVKSVEEAIRWYCDVFGFEAESVHRGPDHPANYAVLRNGNAGLHLGLEGEMENLTGEGGCSFVTRDFGAAHQSAATTVRPST